MSAPLVDPSMARSSLSEQQMQSMQREAEASRRALNGGTSASKEKKLRQACEGFEAVFIQKMWEGMRSSLPKEGLLHSREEQFWQGMYDQELGKSLAAAGGIGLADMMMTQLSRNLQDASEVAAARNGRRPMDIAPVPLIPAGTAAPDKAPARADVYEGEAGQPSAPAAQTAEASPAGAETPAPAAAGVPNPTPPQVMGPLREFAASLGVAPPDTGAGQTFPQTAPKGAVGPLAQADAVPGVQVFKAGQQPPRNIDELAAALAERAARETGGPVRVITTRQVSDQVRSRPMPVQRVVRRKSASPAVSAGSPVTGRGGLAGVAQGGEMPGPGALTSAVASAAMAGATAAPSAADAPVSVAAAQTETQAGAQAGPTALATSVEGIGAGSELASNTAATQGSPSAGRAGTLRK